MADRVKDFIITDTALYYQTEDDAIQKLDLTPGTMPDEPEAEELYGAGEGQAGQLKLISSARGDYVGAVDQKAGALRIFGEKGEYATIVPHLKAYGQVAINSQLVYQRPRTLKDITGFYNIKSVHYFMAFNEDLTWRIDGPKGVSFRGSFSWREMEDRNLELTFTDISGDGQLSSYIKNLIESGMLPGWSLQTAAS